MRIITIDDFLDTYFKIIQRGGRFILSKFTLNEEKRIKSAFDNTSFISSYCWSIPKVIQRWNYLMTGDKNIHYINFLTDDFFKSSSNLRLLSLGSGICNREIELAQHKHIFKEIVCVDIAENLLEIASKNAKEKKLDNITFLAENIDSFDFKEDEFDIVFFKSSLHHFNHIEAFLSKKIKKTLKPNGVLIINEFVGATRHQFSKQQIKAINKAIAVIPKQYRTRFKSKFRKNKYRGVGILRMIMADPSECIDSASIMPSIHKHFKTILEKPYGGNLLISALRDISHHFFDINTEKEKVLDTLFAMEDEYLKHNTSDLVFGIYENSK